jgi:transcriptional regulator with GAF, ATPase, and Fis domain
MDLLHATRETREAIDELEPFVDGDLFEELLERGRRVRALVPDCVGLSLAPRRHDVTFTLVASDHDIAVLNAMQYLDDRPCVTAVRADRVLEFQEEELIDEHDWHLAETTAAAGVRSTLRLPIIDGGEVSGSVNLYAASRHAFDRCHEEVATIFSAWAPGAIANADLSFDSRRRAAEAPARLRAGAKVATPVGIIAGALGVAEEIATRALTEAAICAGVTEVRLAEALIAIRQRSASGDA